MIMQNIWKPKSIKYSKIKENYFYILEVKEKGWVIDTQINYSRVNSYLGAWLKHHHLSHDQTLSANQRSLNVRYISCNHALVS